MTLIARLRLLFTLLRGGEEAMAMVYATLIINGMKIFADVPALIKAQVQDILVALDLAELAGV